MKTTSSFFFLTWAQVYTHAIWDGNISLKGQCLRSLKIMMYTEINKMTQAWLIVKDCNIQNNNFKTFIRQATLDDFINI